MQVLTIESVQWQLLHYQLPKVVGGSGVRVVDVIVCDVVLSSGVKGFGFSYAIGGRGRASMIAAQTLAHDLIVGSQMIPPEAIWRQLVIACNRV